MFFKEHWGFVLNFVALSEYIDFKEKAALLEKEQMLFGHKFSNSFFQGKKVPVSNIKN